MESIQSKTELVNSIACTVSLSVQLTIAKFKEIVKLYPVRG